MIPEEKIREVNERAPILDVVSDYVNLKRSGANYLGLCPFHGERTPSFNVNPARGIFHCFGCGVGGNAFSFVMKVEGLTFPEAVRFLAKRVGVEITDHEPTPAERRRQDEREQFLRVTAMAVSFYRRILATEPEGEAARRYLAGRGVTPETAAQYQLGFAADRWDALVKHLVAQRIPLDVAERVGLVKRGNDGKYHDLFRRRLLFPILDHQGEPVGFGGRVLDDSLPKYINSTESPIYRKSEVLFGVSLAKQAMREQGGAIVVEGYFDHLSLFQAGIRNVVATCGTALTDGHIRLLRRYVGKLFTLFDADSAGRKATIRAMDLVLAEGMPAAVIELAGGDDPDSYIRREGSEAFAAQVARARPVLEFFLRDLVKQEDISTIEGKVRVVEEVAPRLQKIANPVERELYIREASRLLVIDARSLATRVGAGKYRVENIVQPQEPRRGNIDSEEMLLALMVKYPEVVERVATYGIAVLFREELVPIAGAIVAQNLANGTIDSALVLEQVPSPEQRSRLASLFVRDEHLEEIDPLKMFEDLRANRERQFLRELSRLRRELAGAEPDTPRFHELLAAIDSLRNRKSQLL